MQKNYLELVKSKYKVVIILTCLVVASVVFITSLMPFEYQSNVQLLIIQDEASSDLYQASRAAERLGESLSKVIYTTSFYEKALDTKLIDSSYFSEDEQERRELWSKSVASSVIPGTSILEIYTYSTDKQKAENLASAIAMTLSKNGAEYYGEENNVEIKLINDALTSKNPVKPNLPVNIALGIVIGLALSAVYLLFVKVPTLDKFGEELNKESESKNKVEIKKDKIEDIFEDEIVQVLEVNNFKNTDKYKLEPIELVPEFSMYDHLS